MDPPLWGAILIFLELGKELELDEARQDEP